MKDNELLNALSALLRPVIRDVVLATIEEFLAAKDEVRSDAEVTPAEAAMQLHVSKVTLWRWDRDNYLKPVKVGRKAYYRQADLDRLKKGI